MEAAPNLPSDATRQLPDSVDVAVIGGGPAGSTMASLVAREGWSVALLEKDRHPRFHIGESLLPHNMKIFRRLGVENRLAEIGVFKPGADFTADEPEEHCQEIRFADALDVPSGCDHAYQVLRSEFDGMLFRQAARSGAQVFTDARVKEATFDGPDPVLSVHHDGRHHQLRTRFVVDASGRDTFLARKFGLQERNREHATAALYGHFRQVPRREGNAAGNISIYWFRHGWIWMIPLPGEIMSIGAVCDPEYLAGRRGDVERFFRETIQLNPHAWRRMADGRPVSPITATGNYSYSARRLCGRRWLLAGDAGVFVDPVFSSGVFFGMYSAECGVEVVLAELAANRAAARKARRRFRRRVNRGVRELSWFIYRFPAPGMRYLFLNPRNFLGLKQAVISVLAGDVHDNPRVIWRLRLFRLIYALASLPSFPGSLRARRQRRRNARVVFDHVA